MALHVHTWFLPHNRSARFNPTTVRMPGSAQPLWPPTYCLGRSRENSRSGRFVVVVVEGGEKDGGEGGGGEGVSDYCS